MPRKHKKNTLFIDIEMPDCTRRRTDNFLFNFNELKPNQPIILKRVF
tara:strand:+ start:807 stop:947 length:141 start_codon:yes stop_codon:yes gene_type:complete